MKQVLTNLFAQDQKEEVWGSLKTELSLGAGL